MIISQDLVASVFIILSSFYFALLIAVYVGLTRLRSPSVEATPSISLVIAARNEEKRILPCLESLQELDYQSDRYEIIFVDDCSSDTTPQIVGEFCKKHHNWRLIRLKDKSDELRGKMNALDNGIAAAKNEIIFTTDADCVVPKEWFRHLAKYFQPGVAMVLGHSPLTRGQGFFHKLQEFDNLFSAICASALTKMGFPFTSIGRNLAYRLDAYKNAGGFKSLQGLRSGDDVHLTERFRSVSNGKMDYCADPRTFVLTQPSVNARELFHQQVRKNSKTFRKSGASIGLSLLLFGYHLLFLILAIFYPALVVLWVASLAAKLILENICLRKAAKVFDQEQMIPYFPLMQVIYPAYIIFLSLLGELQFYSWKK